MYIIGMGAAIYTGEYDIAQIMLKAGLGIAGLNFVGNAKYNEYKEESINIPQYEFISYILSNYKNIEEVKEALKNINITNDQYSKFPVAYLHWIISDTNASITVESIDKNRIERIRLLLPEPEKHEDSQNQEDN